MDLTGAQKYMDPHVMLPRWTNMMGKLLDAFKNNPEAIEILLQFMESEGPKGTVVATKAQRLLENGKEIAIDYGGKESGCDEIPPEVEYSNNWNGQARRQWRSNNAKRGAAHLKEYWKKKKMDEHLAKQAAAATQAARQESAQTPQDTPNE
jgi:hypothetical protein